MKESNQATILLKTIVENLYTPEKLDNHPWAHGRMVKKACELDNSLRKLSPGGQLVETICIIFRKMMPNLPPRCGIRLDTRWGEFGILAAQYFAPYVFGVPYPTSFREAWQGIDRAILLFAFNREVDVSEEDRNRYNLVGDEPEIAPDSTISDWHRKGLERLAGLVIQYDKHLELKAKAATKSKGNLVILKQFIKKIRLPRTARLWLGRIAMVMVFGLLVLGVWRGWVLFQRVQSVKLQAEELLTISNSFSDLKKVQEVSQRVSYLRIDLESLKKDVMPLLKITPYMGWLPVYGGDFSQAPYLIEMAVQMSIVGDEVFQALSPILPADIDSNYSTNILSLLSELKDANTQLLTAQVALANVQSARRQIQTERLSLGLRTLVNEKIDPLLFSLETAFPVTDVLQMARLAPRILGAVDNGPQTYMILIQNEDELRPTGGFLTAVGLMVVEDGKLISLSFESSELVDDLSKPYPKAPWQLDEYMMAEILLFRDSNWFTNFPTTVEWAKFLYAYTRSKAVDGVIAIDQQVVEELLRIVGPINVVGVDDLISANNVLKYMRSAKEQTPPAGVSRREWDRKQFINWLADPLVEKLISVNNQSWTSLSAKLIQLLDEKHILLQFNDPEMSTLLAQRGWDGAVRPDANSDFLMVVDSNVGFNKTNALIQTDIDYTVNLTNLNQPLGYLAVMHTNNSQYSSEASSDCMQRGYWRSELPLDEREYIMNDCYWAYLRVYSPAETKLIASIPHEIPEKWPLRERTIPARTDLLKENIIGAQVFGTILVVPIGEVLETNFTYQLPETVVKNNIENKTYTYYLKIQKQPGTLAGPLTFHFQLPTGMIILSAPSEFQRWQEEWVLKTNLKKDVVFEIVFQRTE